MPDRRRVYETPQVYFTTEDGPEGVAVMKADECNSTHSAIVIPWEALPDVISDLAMRNRIRPEERKRA